MKVKTRRIGRECWGRCWPRAWPTAICRWKNKRRAARFNAMEYGSDCTPPATRCGNTGRRFFGACASARLRPEQIESGAYGARSFAAIALTMGKHRRNENGREVLQ